MLMQLDETELADMKIVNTRHQKGILAAITDLKKGEHCEISFRCVSARTSALQDAFASF